MKFLTVLLALIFSVMFTSPSFAEWTKVGVKMNGNTNYIDFERMRKVDGYVYYWKLNDLLKPDKDGDLSYRGYYQGNCKLFRLKVLSASYHKEPMGGGTGKSFTPKRDDANWIYSSPESGDETDLKTVCSW